MTFKSLLTYGAKVGSVEQVYYAPNTVVPPNYAIPLSSVYCVLAKNDPWDDENNPPQPTQDQQYIKSFYNKIFAAKLITSDYISPVIQRIDWTFGSTYDFYQDNIDMFATDSNGFLILNFYVKNRYDQVFKCLFNNSSLVDGVYVGTPSTDEPKFQPGSYNTNKIYTGTDGYKWKYMFTVDTGAKVKFMDSNWIPVPVGQNTPNPLTTAAGIGDVEVINVVYGGSGYNTSNAPVYITVTGDGTGANGTASVNNTTGMITDITINYTGSNYSYANVVIQSANGAGAIAIAPVSPVSGHGYDPISELGCSHVMLCAEFSGDERIGGVPQIPTDIMYHQIGLMVNPVDKNSSPNPANGSTYRVSTSLTVSPGAGVFQNDELIYQTDTSGTTTFVGTVLSFNTSTNQVYVINISGTPTLNGQISGNSSRTTRALLQVDLPVYVAASGYLASIENRTGIQRSPDGIEQFKFVLGY